MSEAAPSPASNPDAPEPDAQELDAKEPDAAAPVAPPRRWTRRRFLLLGVAGSAAVILPHRFFFYGEEVLTLTGLANLSPRQGAILAAALDAMLPPGADRAPERLREHVRFVDGYLTGIEPANVRDFGRLLFALEHATLPFGPHLHRFTRLDHDDRTAYLQGWQTSRIGLRRLGLKTLKTMIFLAHYRDAEAFRAIGYPGPMATDFAGPEPSRRRYDALLAPPGSFPD